MQRVRCCRYGRRCGGLSLADGRRHRVCGKVRPQRWLVLALLFLFSVTLRPLAQVLSDPEVDRYNVRVGTQTFAGLYQFSTNTLLTETADAIRRLGTDTVKFYLGPDYPRQYRLTLPPSVTNLLTLARDEPSTRGVFDGVFRHYIVWIYPFGSWWPFDGYSSNERTTEYREVYDLARYFLTNYNNSGKTFYLGHWEGDGHFMPWSTNPSPTAIQGMIDWLNNRQMAVDNAKRATPHTNVEVFCYAEPNRVRDAMVNGPANNQRVINRVIPYVTNLDYLSYSSYDAMNLGTADLYATLDYMESKLPTNKCSVIPGERIWIGEYGWGGSQSPAQQEPTTRAYLQRLLRYGRQGLPFILFWEIYNNETNQAYCLIDSNNVKTACYDLHQRFINQARLLAARFKETNGRLPSDAEFVGLVGPMLDRPLPAPLSLSVSNLSPLFLNAATARISGRLTQGIYGEPGAAVRVYWGRQDGGTLPAAWGQGQTLGVNTNFNPTVFSLLLTNLAPQANYYFRFCASNANGQVWAPESASIRTLEPRDFARRLRVTFTGYDRGEPMANLPVLVNLSANLPGFDYAQFASPAGADLRFTDASGLLLLPHEIDEWNTNGISSVWVRVPSLSSTNDYLWAYWGSAAAAAVPPSYTTNGAVWRPGHELVWHLREPNLPYRDSAQQHPALSSAPPTSTAGVVGHGAAFDGVSQFLQAGAIDLGEAFTLSAWVRVDPAANSIQTVWANKSGGWAANGFAFYVNSYQTRDQKLLLETGNGSSGLTAATGPNAVTPGQWHHLAAVVDRLGGTARLFVDGLDRTGSSAIRADFANQAGVCLGRFADGSFYFKGAMDEVRIEPGLRSATWVWANWMTAARNSSLGACSEVNPRPVLALVPSPAGLWLTWPANAGVFSPFTTTGLALPVAWAPVTNSIALLNGLWQLQLPSPTQGQAFFRLVFP